ncbi:MAG: quinoprotein dehydrogenase-associated putative ABC transporter substrate-binding protein, partial [Gemmatimonadales bacterium]
MAALVLLGCGSSKPAAELRVCADPNNLPFSNRAGEGLENHLAELIAQELRGDVKYTWWPQRRGFIRSTLAADSCDVVMGIPAGSERVLTTQPYYRSS